MRGAPRARPDRIPDLGDTAARRRTTLTHVPLHATARITVARLTIRAVRLALTRHQRGVLDAAISITNQPLRTVRVRLTALLEQVDALSALAGFTMLCRAIAIRQTLQATPREELAAKHITPRLGVRSQVAKHTRRRRARLAALDRAVEILETLQARTRHGISDRQARRARLLARAISGRLASPISTSLAKVTIPRITALVATEFSITPGADRAGLPHIAGRDTARQRELAPLAQRTLIVHLALLERRATERRRTTADLAGRAILAAIAQALDAISFKAPRPIVAI